jgi:urease accessory protein
MIKRTLVRSSTLAALLAALSVVSTAASAHTGHGSHSLAQGLAHPFGLDHLLAMLAVGVWSATALRGARRWAGPASFLAAMTVGAALGAAGLALPLTELGIAASVAMLGLMLLAGRQMPPAVGLVLIALAAALHGLAHGAEMSLGGSFAAYAAGFTLTTALLHTAGVGLGVALAQAQAWVWRSAALATTAAGLALMARA